MKTALEGIRVVDLSHVLAAPTTTMILADLGAEVIHVEPPEGDDAKEICEDPLIRHRNMLVTVDQPGIGPVRIAGSPIRLSETPGRVITPAPLLGEHSEEVLRTVLGYNGEEIEILKAEGVIRTAD